MYFWRRQDPDSVPSAVPVKPEAGGWWFRLKEGVGMGAQPEEIELGEPSLLQQVNQVTTLNRMQVSCLTTTRSTLAASCECA